MDERVAVLLGAVLFLFFFLPELRVVVFPFFEVVMRFGMLGSVKAMELLAEMLGSW